MVDERHEVGIAIFQPAVDAELALTGVSPQNHSVGTIEVNPMFHDIGRGDSQRADGDHGGPILEGKLEVLVGLDASSEVDCQGGGTGDGTEGAGIDDVAGLSTVEVNEMEAREAHVFEALGHLDRVAIVNGHLVVVALGESDALSSDDIYGGDEMHGDEKLKIKN